MALVYCLGISEDTRVNVNKIYDFVLVLNKEGFVASYYVEKSEFTVITGLSGMDHPVRLCLLALRISILRGRKGAGLPLTALSLMENNFS